MDECTDEELICLMRTAFDGECQGSLEYLEGIDRICAYMDAIWEEQIYLRQFPREEVIGRLRSFHPHYEREYFNVREIVQNN